MAAKARKLHNGSRHFRLEANGRDAPDKQGRRRQGWQMELTVRFFALYRERAGLSRLDLDLPENSTVGDMTGEVRRRYPNLAPPEVKIVVAVNAEYAEPDTVLKAGDDVCLIPPVSGG